MSADQNTTDQPGQFPSLAAALAAFQRDLPTVTKGTSGQVRGRQNYKYADLADVNGVVLPALGAVGLSFSCKPTINEAGRFVLAYVLRHDSGQEDAGEYPLPEDVSPQDMGSAQTYAKRYVIQAITGVAPDEDDDGAAAARAYSHRGQSQQSRNGAQNGHQGNSDGPRTSQPPADEPALSGADQARDALVKKIAVNKWDGAKVAAEFAHRYAGADIRTETNGPRIEAFTKLLDDVPADQLRAVPATNGAAQ